MSSSPSRHPRTAPTSPSHPDGPLPLRFVQGMAMGGADVIPGVSGGTVALILGVYTTLIAAIRSVASTVTALLRGRRGAAAAHWGDVPWRFVLPLGIGMIAAVGVGSVVLPPLLESFPMQTSAVFFGMILASLAVPWRDAGTRGPAMMALAAVAALAAFLIMGLPAATEVGDPPTWRIFASASVAICAMILPGVSGAFLLLALGVYEPTLSALRHLDLGYVATFGLGAIVGLGVFSKLLGHLLEHRLGVTMAALTGLMLGALRVLWPWGGMEGDLHAPADLGDGLLGVALIAAGFIVVRVLLALGDRTAHRADLDEAAEHLDSIEDPA